MAKNLLLVLLTLTGCGVDEASETTGYPTSSTTDCIPADETCNGIDDDCDGLVDESDAVDAFTFYEDADADGFGNPGSVVNSCDDTVEGYLLDENTDCDDTVATTNPAA